MSYRRSDGGGYSGRVTDALGARLGVDNVFHDVVGIGPGRNFENEIERSLAAADVVLAVIGPGWISSTTATGALRLFESDDFVRRELSSALASKLPVVPVLVGGASLPTAEDLPEDLADLAKRQASVLRDESFHADIDRLLTTLQTRAQTDVGGARSRRQRRFTAVAAAVLVLAGSSATAWWVVGHRHGSTHSSSLDPCPALASGTWHEIAVAPSNSVTIRDNTAGSITVSVKGGHWRQESTSGWYVVLDTQMENQAAASVYHDAGKYYRLLVARREFVPACFDGSAEPVNRGAVGDARIGFVVHCAPQGQLSLTTEWNDTREGLAFTNATSPGDCTAS